MNTAKKSRIAQSNFGLNGQRHQVKKPSRQDSSYDYLFWESQETKDLRNDRKRIENEGKAIRNQAMLTMMQEDDGNQSTGPNVGNIVIVGVLIVLGIVGAGILFKNKSKSGNSAIQPNGSSTPLDSDALL